MSVLANAFPPLDAATEAALRASIKEFGVLVEVVEDQHGRTLDGHHRRRIAEDLNVAFRVHVEQVVDDEHAADISRTLNADRRHLTRQQRMTVTVALRDEGHSTRAIAGAVGASEATIRRDLAAGASHDAPDRVTGKDGKSYPAAGKPKKRRRRRTKERVERPDFAVFHTTVHNTIDVLERFAADPAALAAQIPAHDLGGWIGQTRELARHAVQLADGLEALPVAAAEHLTGTPPKEEP